MKSRCQFFEKSPYRNKARNQLTVTVSFHIIPHTITVGCYGLDKIPQKVEIMESRLFKVYITCLSVYSLSGFSEATSNSI